MPHASTSIIAVRSFCLVRYVHRPAGTLLASAAALLLGLFAPNTAIADDTRPVHGAVQAKNGKKSKDVSGIACASPLGFPRTCLVIDDNAQAAQLVRVEDGEIQAGEMIPLIDNRFKGKALELDGEGVAYTDGFFYVIGWHGRPRDSEHKLGKKETAARIAASSQIVRFRPEGSHDLSVVERQGKLRAIIDQEPALSNYLDRRLEDNGLTIEGVAVSERTNPRGVPRAFIGKWPRRRPVSSR
ncbi:DUF3616 domain-containing protein [Bradyrhizobium sp. B124]|uniref:DUF3616 domain-containing protein n=1 Tax=Bradyrhizobium sp. B124 TaxID=3140245 RepID=UPI00318388CB